MSEDNKPTMIIFANDDEFSYETELTAAGSVLLLEAVKKMILDRVVGAEVPDNE